MVYITLTIALILQVLANGAAPFPMYVKWYIGAGTLLIIAAIIAYKEKE